MLGVIVGDIVGSPYEFANTKNPRFPLFSKESEFTDDTVLTIAVADAILSGGDFGESLYEWGWKYRNSKGAYGGSFNAWLDSPDPAPYNSFGNGAATLIPSRRSSVLSPRLVGGFLRKSGRRLLNSSLLICV